MNLVETINECDHKAEDFRAIKIIGQGMTWIVCNLCNRIVGRAPGYWGPVPDEWLKVFRTHAMKSEGVNI